MSKKPRILVTNDDGYYADGIIALEEALKEIGDVYVVAPSEEKSGASHSLTLARPLRIRQTDERHWIVDGTPTDCVTLALNQILSKDELPNICVSGINAGPNLGDDATYSGTVAGALEATILGVAGIAFSMVATRNQDYTESAKIAKELTAMALQEGLPKGTLLNINVPKGVPKGVRVTKQGAKDACTVISEHLDPRGKPYYWVGEVRDGFYAKGNTDFEAIDEGYVSITPMQSDLTNHAVLGELKRWES